MPRKYGIVPATVSQAFWAGPGIAGGEHSIWATMDPASREKYARLIAELSAGSATAAAEPPASPPPDLSVNELLLRYFEFAQSYYVRNGVVTKEYSGLKEALLPVRQLFGLTRARDLGQRRLKTVQQQFIDNGICRNLINRRISRINSRVFKWAVAEELISGSRAPQPAIGFGAAVRSHCSSGNRANQASSGPLRCVRSAIRVSARGGHDQAAADYRNEAGRSRADAALRYQAVRRSARSHLRASGTQNERRGHRKLVALGPEAQEILKPFLNREPTSFLFSPRESEAWRLARRPVRFKNQRKTPIYPSELRGPRKSENRTSPAKIQTTEAGSIRRRESLAGH